MKYTHKEWLSAETLKKIAERQNKNAALNNSHARSDKVRVHTTNTERKQQKGEDEHQNRQELW